MTEFTYHDNNSHHESLDDWMKRNIFMKSKPVDKKVHVTLIEEGNPV